MRDHTSTIRVQLLGPLQILSDFGADLTPKGAKNQGLVAMLVLAPEMQRSRAWLARHLWSSFGEAQASANLRQALRKLRSALGPAADVLHSSGRDVGFDRARVTLDLLDGGAVPDPRHDLLSELAPRDPAFAEWLRQERAAWRQRGLVGQRISARGVALRCRVGETVGDDDRAVAQMTVDRIAAGVSEHVRAWRQAEGAGISATAPPADLILSCDVLHGDGGRCVFVRCLQPSTGEILVSTRQPLRRIEDLVDGDADVSRLIFESTESILMQLPQALGNDRPEARATALAGLAVQRMLSFEAEKVRDAVGLLREAHALEQNAVYLAWQGIVRLTQLIERFEPDRDALLEEIADLHRRARDTGQDNPLVLALLSKLGSTIGVDPADCLDLARHSLARNPASAFGWKALSEAQTGCGNSAAALGASSQALRIARHSRFRHWWDIGHALTSLACNQYTDAMTSAEATLRGSRRSRPALRLLIALYVRSGRLDDAMTTVQRLTRIEPDFTLRRFIEDPDYPVRTLRQQGLLDPVRVLL